MSASLSSDELDALPSLPAQNKRSVFLVLLVQALNAFNDNFVKMLLVSLGLTVAKDTPLGGNMLGILVIMFSVPFVLFAPLAGWMSDRFSKRGVSVWMQVAQLACLGAIGGAISMRDTYWSLLIGLIGFFLLAIQATFFSPAKLGIMKEIAGARRLGPMNGMLQMTMLVCVLAGIWAGGTVYESMFKSSGNPWTSALFPLVGVGVLGSLQLLASVFIQRTPEHAEVVFEKKVAVQHFGQLKLLFSQRPIRLAATGIMFFWFVSNAIGIIVQHLAVDMGRGPAEVSKLAALLGVGVMIGSLLAGLICKKRIELGLIPVAGFGMVIGLMGTALAPLGGSMMYLGLVFAGVAGGCFMVPLYAFVQDRAVPEERSRILSSVNLMDCMGTILVAGVVMLLVKLGLSGRQQLMFFGGVAVFMTLFTTRLLPQQVVRFLMASLVRGLYKVEAVNPDRVPKEGGVLLLPNHVSYVDALVISVACDRPVRFVMWDSLYKVWWMNGFLRLFGTVPISPTRAKDAIRTVSEALKSGEAVGLFPEGQLTKLGMVNEIRKGFELMVRQSNMPVIPVYQDGLWGSIFSHEGAGVFKKLPKSLRYPVRIHFGELIPASEAKTDRVREAILKLGSEAMCAREPEACIERMNEIRLSEIPEHDATKRYIDAPTGAIIAVQLPDPKMPADTKDEMFGTREGTLGRLLPGLAVQHTETGLIISGFAPTSTTTITLEGMKLDDAGFIAKRP